MDVYDEVDRRENDAGEPPSSLPVWFFFSFSFFGGGGRPDIDRKKTTPPQDNTDVRKREEKLQRKWTLRGQSEFEC